MTTLTTPSTKPKRKYTRRAEKFSKKITKARANPQRILDAANSLNTLTRAERELVIGLFN